MRVKMSKQPPPAPTASAVGPCPTVIQIVGRPGTGSLPCTIAPPDHPYIVTEVWFRTCGRAIVLSNFQCQGILRTWIIVRQGPTA